MLCCVSLAAHSINPTFISRSFGIIPGAPVTGTDKEYGTSLTGEGTMSKVVGPGTASVGLRVAWRSALGLIVVKRTDSAPSTAHHDG